MMTTEEVREFRDEFLKALTVDTEIRSKGHRTFRPAIFDAERGYAVFTGTDLGMVMDKLDQALAATVGRTMLERAMEL